jgi:hypothetical protein
VWRLCSTEAGCHAFVFSVNIRIFAPGIKVVDAKPIVDGCRTSILTVPEKQNPKLR